MNQLKLDMKVVFMYWDYLVQSGKNKQAINLCVVKALFTPSIRGVLTMDKT